MDLRHRNNEPRHRNEGDPDGIGPEGENLLELHNQGQEFLNAGSQILNAALSGDSQAFLAANRQHGGQ
jgi:hypothetical protein